ncbi:tetratricopeptide repeat protein [Candidatus Pelagibacter sp.]|nr:tetratricopeptide repeat protein [Candidatus Pelagibacter sp.]
MKSDEVLFNEAKALHLKGEIIDAQEIYLRLLKKNSNNSNLLFLLGTTYVQQKNYQKGKSYLDVSIKINSNFPECYNSRGIIFAEEGEYQNAIKDYDKALSLKQDYFDANLNKAVALRNISEFDESIKYLEICIRLKPNDSKIYNNFGNLCKDLKKYNTAKKYYTESIRLNKNSAEAYNNRGELLQLNFNEFEKAIQDFDSAIKINKDLDYIKGKILHAKMSLHDWNTYNEELKTIKDGIKNKKKTIYPFAHMSLIDDPEQQKIITELYLENNNLTPSKVNINLKNKKIIIGYFSAEFHNHAVMHLMLDVFKNHNKSEFKIYGFSIGPKKDEWTKKVKVYFDEFIDVSNMSDTEIKSLSKKLKLDVAINLTGHTLNARNSIFFNQVAPKQVNYLGYPGTMGSKFYDYIIADKIVIPEENKKYFSEEVIYLPNCYQANQEKIEVSNKKLNKKDFGLPKNKFIFGCFNNSYKITPLIFKSWMNILKNYESSVIWLLQDQKLGKQNLWEEAEKQEVNKERIIFAERLPAKEHLKRIELIDLFLDTFPYNAHTTASEAIRAGVPILTLKGKSFHSRVASSILINIGLENLIVSNLKDYETKAISLAKNYKEIESLKKHLAQEKNLSKLFDSKVFTKDLEKIYKKIIN